MKRIQGIALLLLITIVSSATILVYNEWRPTEKEKAPIHFNGLAKIIKLVPTDYESLWKQVKEHESNGLPKSALEVVQNIYKKAKEEGDKGNFLKAVIHIMKYNVYLVEDDYVVALDDLNKIASESEEPMKQFVHSMIAEIYWGYYSANRWKFQNRTFTTDFKNEDIRTWDLTTLADKVFKNYLLSVKNPTLLKNEDYKDYDEVIYAYGNSRAQRPKLYDFLAHRAIDYFMNTEPDISKPSYTFTVDDPRYFGTAEEFIKLDITSRDSMSSKFYATKLLQELTAVHVNDPSPEAIMEVELKRLNFVKTYFNGDNADSLYYSALEKLAKKFEGNDVAAEPLYLMANFHSQNASKYKPNESDKYKNEYNVALEMCNKAIEKYPKSFGAGQCKSLIVSINMKSLSISSEQVAVPDKPSQFLVNSRNLKKLHFRLIKLDWDFERKDARDQEELMKKYIGINPIRSWEQDLKDDGDHQNHNYEMDLDALPMGCYVVLASDDKEFSLKNNAIAYTTIGVSNLSYTYRRNNDETYDVQVFHRETGMPLAGVKAQIFYREYNYTFRKYEIKNGESYTSDENGGFNIKSTKDYRYFYIDLQMGKDRMNTLSSFYQYKHYEYSNTQTITHFFTDRAIYRPGQTIYFKGMRIRNSGDERSLVTNSSVTVTFYDPNYQKISSLDLETNEYGTFSGTFTAPNGVLNGQMHITDGYGTKYIRVEEYKRPKFEVTFNPVEGTFKLGDKVKVKGLAKSYAGSVVDGAKVKYRIVRSASFPYWCYWRWGYRPYSKSLEVTHGEMVSDENGNFEIEFESSEDKTVSRKYYPTYTYTVYADVTDINGETHSASKYVRVGRNAMELSIWMPENLNVEDAGKLKVNTMNLNGVKVNASGSVTIHKIKNPEKIFRDRMFSQADRHSLSKEEFDKKFPYDEYANENDHTKWPKEKQILSLDFNTEKYDSVDFSPLKNAAPGIYVMEAKCKDAFGETVEDIRYFTVYDTKSKIVPAKKPFWMEEVEITCEPGDKAKILLGTSWNDCKVLYEIEHKGKIVDKKWITLNNEQSLIEIPVEEKHRGNFSVHFTWVKNNRHYVTHSTINVPRTDKQLDIEFSTFRNKLLPGQQEEWKITLKGKKGDKAAAELLMTMYDASLDVFAANGFWMSIYNSYYAQLNWNSNAFNSSSGSLFQREWNEYSSAPYRYYDHLNWHGYSTYYYGYRYNYYYDDYDNEEGVKTSSATGRNRDSNKRSNKMSESPAMASMDMAEAEEQNMDRLEAKKDESKPGVLGGSTGEDGAIAGDDTRSGDKSVDLSDVKARTNLNETAFFYPHLESNENGEVVVKFTVPEALTKWKILGLAHTKDLRYGMVTKELVTQKELMVMPNMPRFFREGDKITLVTKISNISEGDLEGTAQLMLFDALTMKSVDDKFNLKDAQVKFSAKKGQSAPVSWSIEIPHGMGAVTYRVVAKAGNFSDGEEMAVPVLTNRMLVTESMPLPIRKKGSKTFTFQKLIDSKSSTTLKNHKLTLEMTSNPAWYAIQALPYMIEYPYECSEQIFTRFYANSIASHIVNSSPKIKNVFESWKSSSPDAFLSNLQKNQELKAVMLEETPWVLDAQNESERKKRVALLFDLNKMDNELGSALKKLKKAQVSNGGWPWFAGMPESRWVTQYIITGMGHLDKLGVKNVRENNSTWNMVKDAVRYCDNRIVEDYKWIKKHYPDYKTEQHIGYFEVQYLYARSYYMDIEIKGDVKEAVDYYKAQMKEYWLKFNLKGKGMIAMAAHRMEMKELALGVMKSLKEYLLSSEELGMYFKENITGYYWYEQPIEVQALMIEAFDEVTNDQVTVEELKVWLLKQKQTTDWKTTTATAEACFSLLLRGVDILENDEIVEVKLDDMVIDPTKLDVKTEAGTGYYKTSWSGDAIKPEWGNITVSKKTDGVSWGALYWQYFEDLDKITFAETNLKLSKKLFLVKTGDAGISMSPVTEKTILTPGDKVRVRIELRSDRDMEYVHMKDMRASCFEPVNVLSRYKWQDGLGYYESTKDAATNFFIEYLRKGTYVFEYDLLVSHVGDFSNGITSIQCMYAPEFTSHSEGIRVTVKGK
jgi:hypothetical protein